MAFHIVEENPDVRLPYLYLIDNLLADHRANEAENYLERVNRLPDARPVMVQVYQAHIALARFDEKTADRIIENLVAAHPEDFVCLFEAAQYYAKKCNYSKAIELYERSFEKETRRPRFSDELMGIADIYEIMGEYGKAAETCDRIINLLENEWGVYRGYRTGACTQRKGTTARQGAEVIKYAQGIPEILICGGKQCRSSMNRFWILLCLNTRTYWV